MKTIHVAAAVIVDQGRIFTACRGYGEFKGYWEFPGGKIEKDENRKTPSSAKSKKNWRQILQWISSLGPWTTTIPIST